MSDSPERRLLAIAIEREQWELAALCLLVGVTEAARALPPEAVEALIDVLAAEPDPSPRRRGRRRDRRS